jgi:hypothetical protein
MGTLPPSITKPAMERLHGVIGQLVCEKLELGDWKDLPKIARQQMQIPETFGGLGLRNPSRACVASFISHVLANTQHPNSLSMIVSRHLLPESELRKKSQDPVGKALKLRADKRYKPHLGLFREIEAALEELNGVLEEVLAYDQARIKCFARKEDTSDALRQFDKTAGGKALRRGAIVKRSKVDLTFRSLFTSHSSYNTRGKQVKAAAVSRFELRHVLSVERSGLNQEFLQKKITSAYDCLLIKEIQDTAQTADIARIHTQAMAPVSVSSQLSPADFKLSIKMLLGLPVSKVPPTICDCGIKLTNGEDADGHQHFLNCVKLRGKEVHGRHDKLVRTIADEWQRLNPNAKIHLEPKAHQAQESRHRLDIKITGAYIFGDVGIDVSVINSSAKSHLVKAAASNARIHLLNRCRRQINVALKEQEKVDKYETYLNENNTTGLHFVILANGGIADFSMANRLLDLMLLEGINNKTLASWEINNWKANFRKRITAAVVAYNVRAVSHGLHTARNRQAQEARQQQQEILQDQM